eukprot:6186184-Pleurochrysis_carterae.AAC.2
MHIHLHVLSPTQVFARWRAMAPLFNRCCAPHHRWNLHKALENAWKYLRTDRRVRTEEIKHMEVRRRGSQ